MLTLHEEAEGNYSRTLFIRELNPDVFVQAKHIFRDYKKRGIILNNDFNDDIWKICDEKSTTSLMKFEMRSKEISPWVDCTFKEYRACIKIYITFNFGELAPFTLQDIARELLKLPSMDAAGVASADRYSKHIAAFLRLLPGGSAERDWVIEQLSEREPKTWSNGKIRQRVLSDFKSYLRFNDVLMDFWQSANANEKLFYFPLYLWWNLTAILPLRVTEFLLTPRNCLEECNGRFSITIRRSKLKGGGRKLSYRISDDYETHTYGITDMLGYEIRAYMNATEDMPSMRLNTLLLTLPHCKYLSGVPGRSYNYYTYEHLNECMQSFFKEAIEPGGMKINNIKLGDTRHLAMISLIISGGSPVICRELAGHADIGISSHYYANISNLVECVTLERLRKSKGGYGASVTGKPKYELSKPDCLQRVMGGYCQSETFGRRDISECLKSVGTDGQIGECAVCPHYRPDQQGLRFAFGDSSAAKSAVDADSRYLMQTVEIVRKGLGYQEDIGAALLRLQYSTNRYSMSIQERFNDGKTKKIK